MTEAEKDALGTKILSTLVELYADQMGVTIKYLIESEGENHGDHHGDSVFNRVLCPGGTVRRGRGTGPQIPGPAGNTVPAAASAR